MTTQRLIPVAVLLAAVLLMGAGVTKAQGTVRIAVRSTTAVSTNADRIIVTGVFASARTFYSSCMATAGFGGVQQGGKVVVVNTSVPVHDATKVVAGVYYSEPLPPGTRLVSLSLEASCNEPDGTWNVYEGTLASPRNLDVALVTTPAGVALTADHEGVVGGGTDEFGIADAVCVKKGSQSIKPEIISDIPLEAGDRLTDFLELDYDPETGETLYACWLEY